MQILIILICVFAAVQSRSFINTLRLSSEENFENYPDYYDLSSINQLQDFGTEEQNSFDQKLEDYPQISDFNELMASRNLRKTQIFGRHFQNEFMPSRNLQEDQENVVDFPEFRSQFPDQNFLSYDEIWNEIGGEHKDKRTIPKFPIKRDQIFSRPALVQGFLGPDLKSVFPELFAFRSGNQDEINPELKREETMRNFRSLNKNFADWTGLTHGKRSLNHKTKSGRTSVASMRSKSPLWNAKERLRMREKRNEMLNKWFC